MTSDTKRTGWPAGLLQDDDRKLSRWLAGRPGARRIAMAVAAAIRAGGGKGASDV
jgi:hypothetical protein